MSNAPPEVSKKTGALNVRPGKTPVKAATPHGGFKRIAPPRVIARARRASPHFQGGRFIAQHSGPLKKTFTLKSRSRLSQMKKKTSGGKGAWKGFWLKRSVRFRAAFSLRKARKMSWSDLSVSSGFSGRLKGVCELKANWLVRVGFFSPGGVLFLGF